MTPSLRFILTCSLLAVPLAACGDDKGTSDSQATATQGTGTDGTTTDGSTTDTTATGTTSDDTTTAAPTTDDPTTGTTTTPGTTTMSPGTTTDDTTTMSPGTTTDDTTDTGVGPAASFAGDIYPIFMANCSCHVQGAPGQLAMPNAMTAYDNLVDVSASQAANYDRVEPGEPSTSYLVAKLKGMGGELGGNPTQMPLNSPPLADDDIALIEDWIADGAQP